jgi:GT2 family glycosyltransferase
MRILAHIHTLNDADIIDRTIEALLQQSHPVDGILLVDNASTDDTLDQPSVKHATVVRHEENLGTSGAVATGMQFALDGDYDWIWVFDADSTAEPDALENLLGFYASLPPPDQEKTAFLACLPRNFGDDRPYHGVAFTPTGLAVVKPGLEEQHYPCHISIWSGCLYRVAAVRRIGLPDPNYVLDWGEFEYGNRVMKAGYQGFLCQDSVIQHNIRGAPSLRPVHVKLVFGTTTFYEFPPIRCYYLCRNMLYFTLYDLAQGRPRLLKSVLKAEFRLTLNFLVRPRNHTRQILSCFRGMWHGITRNIAARY